MAFARWSSEAQGKPRDRDPSCDGMAARPDRSSTETLHAARARPVVACPCCGQPTIRIWRRPSDRLLSAFVPVSRHRCESHVCRWEGNVRSGHGNRAGAAGRDRTDEDPAAPRVPAWFIVHMVLVAVGIVFVFGAAHLDWNRTHSEEATSSFIDWADRTVLNQLPMLERDPGTPETGIAFKP